MKVFLVPVFLLTFWYAINAAEHEVPNFNMYKQLSPQVLEELTLLIPQEMNLQDQSKLQVINYQTLFNDFLDKLLLILKAWVLKNGLGTTSLPDQSIDIKIGHTNLTQGQLNDTATIERYQNATVSYDNASKKLVAEMILRFQNLKFNFKYHTKVTSSNITGQLHGDIKNIRIHVKLGYDFNNNSVSLLSTHMQHPGPIEVWLCGTRKHHYVCRNNNYSWITNAMTTVITSSLPNVILNVVQKNIIADPINYLVDAFNNILHPSGWD